MTPPNLALLSNAELDQFTQQNDANRGRTVLRQVHDFLGRFVVYPSPHAQIAHALWIVHTHLMDRWDTTPRIAFLSAEPASGKSRALEVSELLVPTPVIAVNMSPAYIFRKVGAEEDATILFDEIDTVFGPKAKDNEEIRALLNAGHRRGAVAGRCVAQGQKVVTEEISAYAAVALAGLGWLPDTILSRSVIVRMRRRAANEQIESFRHRTIKPEGEGIRYLIEVWAREIPTEIMWPSLPPEIKDRDADVWEPLITVADLAGGDWPQRARRAAKALIEEARETEPSLGILLLTHLQAVFGAEEKLSTDIVLQKLREIEESPWNDIKGRPLDDRGLARRLRQYGIKPRKVRIGSSTFRGYQREDCLDAWCRYVPPLSPATSGTNGTSGTNKQSQGDSVPDDMADVPLVPLPVPDRCQEAINKNNDVPDVPLVPHFPGDGPAHGPKPNLISDLWDHDPVLAGGIPDGLDRTRPRNGPARLPCAQCNLDDGQQELQQCHPETWLHRECVRFWKGQ
jgi:hypothetical protein